MDLIYNPDGDIQSYCQRTNKQVEASSSIDVHIEKEGFWGRHYLYLQSPTGTQERVHVFMKQGFFSRLSYALRKRQGCYTEVRLRTPQQVDITVLIDDGEILKEKQSKQTILKVFKFAFSNQNSPLSISLVLPIKSFGEGVSLGYNPEKDIERFSKKIGLAKIIPQQESTVTIKEQGGRHYLCVKGPGGKEEQLPVMTKDGTFAARDYESLKRTDGFLEVVLKNYSPDRIQYEEIPVLIDVAEMMRTQDNVKTLLAIFEIALRDHGRCFDSKTIDLTVAFAKMREDFQAGNDPMKMCEFYANKPLYLRKAIAQFCLEMGLEYRIRIPSSASNPALVTKYKQLAQNHYYMAKSCDKDLSGIYGFFYKIDGQDKKEWARMELDRCDHRKTTAIESCAIGEAFLGDLKKEYKKQAIDHLHAALDKGKEDEVYRIIDSNHGWFGIRSKKFLEDYFLSPKVEALLRLGASRNNSTASGYYGLILLNRKNATLAEREEACHHLYRAAIDGETVALEMRHTEGWNLLLDLYEKKRQLDANDTTCSEIEFLLECGIKHQDYDAMACYALLLYQRNREGDIAFARQLLEEYDLQENAASHAKAKRKVLSSLFGGILLTTSVNAPMSTVQNKAIRKEQEEFLNRHLAVIGRERHRTGWSYHGSPYTQVSGGVCGFMCTSLGIEVSKIFSTASTATTAEFEQQLIHLAKPFEDGLDPNLATYNIARGVFKEGGIMPVSGLDVISKELSASPATYRLFLYFLSKYPFEDPTMKEWMANQTATQHPGFLKLQDERSWDAPNEDYFEGITQGTFLSETYKHILTLVLNSEDFCHAIGIDPRDKGREHLVRIAYYFQDKVAGSWREGKVLPGTSGIPYDDETFECRIAKGFSKRNVSYTPCSTAEVTVPQMSPPFQKCDQIFELFLKEQQSKKTTAKMSEYDYFSHPTLRLLVSGDDDARLDSLVNQPDGVYDLGFKSTKTGRHALLFIKRQGMHYLFDPNKGLIRCDAQNPKANFKQLMDDYIKLDDHKLTVDLVLPKP
jgi:hypothetical protein